MVLVRSWRAGLRVLLDLLMAAGLIRLAGTHGWAGVGTAAVIVVIRTVVSAALAGGHPWGMTVPGAAGGTTAGGRPPAERAGRGRASG